MGGFEARNDEQSEQDLWSVAESAEWTGDAWRGLAEMPTGRSSFDAAAIDDTLYVVGGWALCGAKEAPFLPFGRRRRRSGPVARDTGAAFRRRALAVTALDGQLYVIGGMQDDGNVSHATDVFDPSSGEWRGGPTLPGGEMEGFGPAATTLDGQLYVSTSSGAIWRLGPSRDSWEKAGQLQQGRFFPPAASRSRTALRDRRRQHATRQVRQRGSRSGVRVLEICSLMDPASCLVIG